ncbi:unknown [Coraliomargarita sp. CAG:312]|nr:unknown [Coraliomargarita sp. CAG:312]
MKSCADAISLPKIYTIPKINKTLHSKSIILNNVDK